MSSLTIVLYFLVVGYWIRCLRRGGGIGIGVRYLSILNLAYQFLMGPMVYYLAGEHPSPLTARSQEQALLLALGGMLAIVVGGYGVAPRLVRSHRSAEMARRGPLQNRDVSAHWGMAKIIFTIGVFAQLLTPVTYSVPTLRALWSQVVLLSYTGATMMCVSGLHSGKRSRVVLALVASLLAGSYAGLAAGFFGATLLVLFYLLSLVVFWKGATLRALCALALVGVLAFIPYTSWMSGRGALRRAIAAGAPWGDRLGAFLNATTLPSLTQLSPSAQSARIRDRLDQSELLAAALRYTPQVEPYAGGETIWRPVLMALVPRALWPDKPVTAGGSEFVSRFTGMHFGNVSVGLHPLFEFYVNFGVAGAVLGSLLLGIVAGVLDLTYLRRGANNLWVQVGVIQIAWVLVFSNVMAEMAMSSLGAMIVAWAASKAATWSMRPGRSVAVVARSSSWPHASSPLPPSPSTGMG